MFCNQIQNELHFIHNEQAYFGDAIKVSALYAYEIVHFVQASMSFHSSLRNKRP